MLGATRGASALQAGQQHEMQASQSGMTSSGSQKAHFDNQHRPITASGFEITGLFFWTMTMMAGSTSTL
jgi:hypothetical protein